MKTIYKYEITGTGCTLKLPEGALVLKVKEQASNVYLWALVDTEQEKMQDRTFNLYGTGHDVPTEEFYIGTAWLFNGSLVLHVFEKFRIHHD